MKLGIGIPTYNRYDLLEPSLKKYSADFPHNQIYIVDNGHQNILRESMSLRQIWDARKIANGEYNDKEIATCGITLIENQENVGVGASWNQLCNKIFSDGNDYALIINDDIYLGKKYQQIEALVEKKLTGFIKATPDWCCFVIHKDVYNTVGPFDECFYPAYYEDKSYEYRMKLKGIRIVSHPDLNPIDYKSSQTIEKEPILQEMCKKNKRKYIEMWGGEPTKEKYKTPYNAV